MNAFIRKFTLCLTACLLACSQSWAQRGPQDTWYETSRVAMPSGCSPHDLLVTPEGTLLLTDTGNDKIHELEANGSLIRSFGSTAGSADGQFNNPVELAIGPSNRIYVTDEGNHRIQILERNGTFVKAFGTQGEGDGQFSSPRGLDISSDNEVFVSETGNDRIQVFDANGTFLRKWGSLGSLEGQMNDPHSLEVDEGGTVYVSDYNNKRVNVFSRTGEFLYKFETSRYSNYSSVSFLKLYPSGILATGGETTSNYQNLFLLREKNGASIKSNNFGDSYYKGSWSPSTQFDDGTIVFARRSSNNLIFLTQTYRALRPNPSKDAPLPEVISVTQPAGTNHLEIKYRITDADSAKVKAGLLAFKEGGNDLSKVIVPKTFVGSIAGKLDENTTTGTIHTVTWDANADWGVSYGDVEIAVVAQDDRDLMNFHFLTLPGTDTNSTELKISRSPVGNGDFLNAWYTLLALGDSNISLQDGLLGILEAGNVISPDIISSLQLWLDATDIDGNGQADSLNNDSKVTNWVDKSGSSNNATQANSSLCPTYKTNQLNGKPTLFFDASDDDMATSLNLGAPYTVGIIYNNLDTGDASRRAIQGSSNWLIGPYHRKNSHYAAGWVYQSGTIEKGKYYVTFAVNDSSRSWFYVDGADRTLNSSYKSNPGTIGLGKKGHSYETLNGHIAEVLIFNTALSTTELSNLHTYLSDKWGVGSSGILTLPYASGNTTTPAGREYLFNKMNLREATSAEVTRAKEAATPGVTNKFTPTFKVGPGERPVNVNEYGFDTGGSGYWVVPKN